MNTPLTQRFNFLSHNNYANLQEKLGRHDEAEQHYVRHSPAAQGGAEDQPSVRGRVWCCELGLLSFYTSLCIEPLQLRHPPGREAGTVRRGGAALRSVTLRPRKEALRINARVNGAM